MLFLNRFFIFSLSFGLLQSCSSYRRPESISDKMDRYKTHSENKNPVAKLNANPSWDYSKGRYIASVEDNSNGVSYTNKNLYFLSLYSQYNQFKRLPGIANLSELRHCASFHTPFLTHQQKYKNKTSTSNITFPNVSKVSQLENKNFVSKHPILSLPISDGHNSNTVIDELKRRGTKPQSQIYNRALSIHALKLKRELEELCEHGVSDNYFAYENLITHTHKTALKQNQKSVSILLRTTVYSNLYILNSLNLSGMPKQKKTGRSIASKNLNYFEEVSKRLGVKWTSQYFH